MIVQKALQNDTSKYTASLIENAAWEGGEKKSQKEMLAKVPLSRTKKIKQPKEEFCCHWTVFPALHV